MIHRQTSSCIFSNTHTHMHTLSHPPSVLYVYTFTMATDWIRQQHPWLFSVAYKDTDLVTTVCDRKTKKEAWPCTVRKKTDALHVWKYAVAFQSKVQRVCWKSLAYWTLWTIRVFCFMYGFVCSISHLFTKLSFCLMCFQLFMEWIETNYFVRKTDWIWLLATTSCQNSKLLWTANKWHSK